jgi:hypothetical protein
MDILIDVPSNYEYDWSLATTNAVTMAEEVLEKTIKASKVTFIHNSAGTKYPCEGDVYRVTFDNEQELTFFLLAKNKFKIISTKS